jgi:hypothetical protein
MSETCFSTWSALNVAYEPSEAVLPVSDEVELPIGSRRKSPPPAVGKGMSIEGRVRLTVGFTKTSRVFKVFVAIPEAGLGHVGARGGAK